MAVQKWEGCFQVEVSARALWIVILGMDHK